MIGLKEMWTQQMQKLLELFEAQGIVEKQEDGSYEIDDVVFHGMNRTAYLDSLNAMLQQADKPLTSETICCLLDETPSQYLQHMIAAAGPLMTPADRYERTVEAYTMAPYCSIPKKTMTALKGIRPVDYLKDLPADLWNTDPITVYRGCSDPIQKAQNSLSWTTDLLTASFFYWKGRKEQRRNSQVHLFEGRISKRNIIAYTNGRGEYEIIQYRSVKDIREIRLTEEQLQANLDEWRSHGRTNEQINHKRADSPGGREPAHCGDPIRSDQNQIK